MGSHRTVFFKFVGIHSFLIGLFPFYLPVFLWKAGYTLSDICFFISFAGIGYLFSLRIWETVHRMVSFKMVTTMSMALELVLLSGIFAGRQLLFLPVLALLYGAYNCFFWTTNRILFFESVTTNNSGRHFGNFQIVAAVILKAGVFCGGFLLDKYTHSALFIVSISAVFLGSFWMLKAPGLSAISNSLRSTKPTELISVITFKDRFGSRVVFLLDGLFLYFESFFWMISLFIIVKENYWKLGLMVIGLMGIFGLIFYLIKNAIDKMPVEIIYRTSVLLYGISWILRGVVGENASLLMLFIMLVFITFCTSFFRLAFNKRFFDQAKATKNVRYILLKSYYSQVVIAVFFGLIGLAGLMVNDVENALNAVYFAAGFGTMGYFFYRANEKSIIKTAGRPTDSAKTSIAFSRRMLESDIRYVENSAAKRSH